MNYTEFCRKRHEIIGNLDINFANYIVILAWELLHKASYEQQLLFYEEFSKPAIQEIFQRQGFEKFTEIVLNAIQTIISAEDLTVAS